MGIAWFIIVCHLVSFWRENLFWREKDPGSIPARGKVWNIFYHEVKPQGKRMMSPQWHHNDNVSMSL